jgi:Dolichyl-phosphate-mannose-protein mannosyltransferase
MTATSPPTVSARPRRLTTFALPTVRIEAVVVVAAVIATFFLQVPFFERPMGVDEAVYFTVASSDSLPYTEYFDHKPPLIYAWYKLALFLNGGEPSVVVVRSMAALMLSLTCVAVFLTGRRAVDTRFGAIAAVAFALLSANHVTIQEANTEIFALPAVTFALLAYLRASDTRSPAAWLACGLLSALAVLTKTTFAVPAILLLLLAWRSHARGAFQMVLAGSSAAFIAVLPWLISGHMDDFWFANVTFNLEYSANVGVLDRFKAYGLSAFVVSLFSLPLLVLAAFGFYSPATPMHRSFPIRLWLLALLVSVALTGLALRYYFVALLPSLALLAASGWHWYLSNGRRSWRVVAAIAIPALVASMLGVTVYTADEARSESIRYVNDYNLLTEELLPVVDHYTLPGERIYVVGWAVPLFPILDLQPAARTVFFTTTYSDETLLQQTLAQLKARPPSVVVVADKVKYRDFPELLSFVRANYVQKAAVSFEDEVTGSVSAIVWVRR